MGIINYNTTSGIQSVVQRMEKNGNNIDKALLKACNLNSICDAYLCAIDLNCKNACAILEAELLARHLHEYIVPRELFTQLNASMINISHAIKVRDTGPAAKAADYYELEKYISDIYFPSFSYIMTYIIALGLGEQAVANKLKAKIKTIPTISACMPALLKLASSTPGIVERLQDLKTRLYNKKLSELYNPDLEEDIEKHEELNPLIFENNKLKPEIKEKAIEIADELMKILEESGITFSLKDLVLTGSNASFNYTKDSDIDLHLIADLKNFTDPDGLYPILFNSIKSAFNKKFDIKFYGIPVEVYIEIDGTPVVSNGIYSVLEDNWIKAPVNDTIPDVDIEDINKAVLPWEQRCEKILANTDKKTSEDESEIDEYIADLYELRTTGLANGEYSINNLVFKEIRNKGYLDKLKELRDLVVTNRLSISK